MRQLFIHSFSAILAISLLFACNENRSKTSDIKNDHADLSKYSPEQLYQVIKQRISKSKKDKATDTIPVSDSLKEISTQVLYDIYMEAKREKGIYCYDDRTEMYKDTSNERKANAGAVVAFFQKTDLKKNPDGSFTIIKPISLKVSQKLCDEQRFSDQPANAFCSGFAINKRMVVTAGHCIDEINYNNIFVVFGYQLDSTDKPVIVFKKEQVYSIIKIVDSAYDKAGVSFKDFAVLMVDRDIRAGNIVRKSRRIGKITDKQAVYVAGHPSGLPLKIAPNATVSDNSKANYFVTNLDTYGGNSGSPVFNAATHELEGILVRGGQDYEWFGDCRKNFTCPCEFSCNGEDISRNTQFLKWLKK
jgi:V8-like Glu-specific endopeptidase